MNITNVVSLGTRADVLKAAYENPKIYAVWVSNEDPEFENEVQLTALEKIGVSFDEFFAKLDEIDSGIATLTLLPNYTAENLVDTVSMFLGMVTLADIRIFSAVQADVDTIQKHFC